jgi:hypothetical protein
LGKPTDLVQGTLDLLILKTLSLEPTVAAKSASASLSARAGSSYCDN